MKCVLSWSRLLLLDSNREYATAVVGISFASVCSHWLISIEHPTSTMEIVHLLLHACTEAISVLLWVSVRCVLFLLHRRCHTYLTRFRWSRMFTERRRREASNTHLVIELFILRLLKDGAHGAYRSWVMSYVHLAVHAADSGVSVLRCVPFMFACLPGVEYYYAHLGCNLSFLCSCACLPRAW